MANFEMTFMAIASKNSFLTHEEAAEVLAEFNNQTGNPRQSIEEIVIAPGLRAPEQLRVISRGAGKILAAQSGGAAAPQGIKPGTQRIPTQPPSAEAARPGTQRIPRQPRPSTPNPTEP